VFHLSKAKTLQYLKTKIKNAKILPLLIFKSNEDIDEMSYKIYKTFNTNIIIRSSSVNEDTNKFSNAGMFKTILNIDSNKIDDIKKAIKEVINSYININEDDEILVQPMLKNVKISGVAFSRDIDTLSPYYIINYDESGKTDSVTSGTSNKLKTYIEFKNKTIKRDNKFLDKLINSIKEIENIFNNNALDIEFAYNGNDIYIFQVRAIVKNSKCNLSYLNLDKPLFKLYKKIKKLNTQHPNLLGSYTMFGVMPDWNPAEIIGKKPNPLALSLYKELITDSIWAYQRDNYGYRNLRSHPLLVSFLGVAYIDVRVSFNSFIPKNLDENIAFKLVDYYLSELKKQPSHHDKVEFEIVFSCFDFDTPNRLQKLLNNDFSQNDINKISKSLLTLTNNLFSFYKKDLEKIDILNKKYEDIINSNLSIIDKVYWLNENCKRYGTLPFAGLARTAFVAMSFLKSFVNTSIITIDEYNSFLNSLNTINKNLNIDIKRLSKNEFLEKYGHLRPGTYDITSKRYDENFDKYFGNCKLKIEDISFEFKQEQLLKIDKHLKQNSIKISAKELIEFIKNSLEAREYAKFVFTKSLSQILVLLEKFANKYSISKEDLAYLDYKRVLELYSSLKCKDVKDVFLENIKQNKLSYKITQAIKLPDLITNEEDIYRFYNLQSGANFITNNKIEAEIIKDEEIYTKEVSNKIVCIKSADPGYDFLFSKNIGALVTCYGGANSHMAIRCAELNIPAIIGIGEDDYNRLSKASLMFIDCKTQNYIIIR
jgi:phosphohistidine swiveling domain-containing protein